MSDPQQPIQTKSSRPHLRLYLDTAEVAQWKTWLPSGLFYGVTCNPLLVQRAGVSCQPDVLIRLAREAFALGAQEVHLQPWGDSVAQLSAIGRQFAQADRRIVVKLPATQIGTAAASGLIGEGIPVTLTALYEVHQAAIAAAIGASYIAPYLGRINDAGRDGRGEIAKMKQVLNGVRSQTRILTASIRDVEDISVLAAHGVDTFTFSEAIAQALFNVPATISATAAFEQAAKQAI